MKQTYSRECRNCHHFNYMDLEERGMIARKRHLRSSKQGKTCIDGTPPKGERGLINPVPGTLAVIRHSILTQLNSRNSET